MQGARDEEERGIERYSFMKEEVRRAVWKCKNRQSPGPDRMTVEMIKGGWELNILTGQ